MRNIISYDEIPLSDGKQKIYLRMEETDPNFYINLMLKGYRIVDNIYETDKNTIYVTRRREEVLRKKDISKSITSEEYYDDLKERIELSLKCNGVEKPWTTNFSYDDLINHKYQVPFVLKNELMNNGKEKFLIETEEDYENLIKACTVLLNKDIMFYNYFITGNKRYIIDYNSYLNENFTVQEYVHTPSKFNTSVRLLTSPSEDLLYGSLKYNDINDKCDNTTLLGVLLHDVYPLSTKSIVSNTAQGGKNIPIGEKKYNIFEKNLLYRHRVDDYSFFRVVEAAKNVHKEYEDELGILCGFDFIYDSQKEKWFWLEHHTKPLFPDYARRQGLSYDSYEDKRKAQGQVRATALTLTLQKKR